MKTNAADKKLSDACNVIISLLKHLPTGHCSDFHHPKKDRHNYNEPCPILLRYQKIVDTAETFITENVKKKLINQNFLEIFKFY